ncbi:SAM-dependent methyltransferase [candidate division KSB1 bacterium]|nr:SAM-dependent methyltransferase [candidate division KSB1 bacterium]
MGTSNKISGIADDSKPNAGRIYDYFLGGDHNFEVDRIQGEKLKQFVPMVPKITRLICWFLGEAVRRLLSEGYTQFLDFASGLPVQDHIHQIAPQGTKVIYSDIDPITVAYANEIIGENPDVVYMQCGNA